MSVRVRFAPSPTGFVHIGSLRTALYNYLFAARNEGTYLLRIEDTDQTRLVEGAIEGMLEAMDWAGIHHTEGPFVENGTIIERGDCGPYVQSDRLELYKGYSEDLIEKGHAYYCFCSKERLDQLRETQRAEEGGSKYDGHCREIPLDEARKRVAAGEPHVVRLKLPRNHNIAFDDLVRGHVVVNSDDVDDQVLMKNDGFPTYHLAVIVDDHLMGVTHVIRGEEWLPSTPKHVYLYEAFGWDAPRFVHLPNILNIEKKKLSKRHGDVSVMDFKTKGYIPEALVNYVALVGWSPEDNKEIMTMDEMKASFSFDRVSKSGGVFDVNKLKWMNNQYIRAKDLGDLTALCMPYFVEKGLVAADETADKYDWVSQIVDLSREYIDILSEITGFAERFIGDEVSPEDDEAKGILAAEHVPGLLNAFVEGVEALDALDEASIKGLFKELQKNLGVKGKDLFMPIRIANFGQVHGPDLVKSLILIGKSGIKARVGCTLKQIR